MGIALQDPNCIETRCETRQGVCWKFILRLLIIGLCWALMIGSGTIYPIFTYRNTIIFILRLIMFVRATDSIATAEKPSLLYSCLGSTSGEENHQPRGLSRSRFACCTRSPPRHHRQVAEQRHWPMENFSGSNRHRCLSFTRNGRSSAEWRSRS